MLLRRRVVVLSDFRLLGGCDLDKSYDGPKLSTQEDGSYGITHQFIKDMLEWFKAGKTLPRRYVRTATTSYRADPA